MKIVITQSGAPRRALVLAAIHVLLAAAKGVDGRH